MVKCQNANLRGSPMRISRNRRLVCLAAWLVLLSLCLRPAAAQLLGPEFQVNSYTPSGQADPSAAAIGQGYFVVAWQSYTQDGSSLGVFGQRFKSTGSPVGSEFRVNSYTTSWQETPAVAADGLGNFVVVWESNLQDGSYFGVFGQRYDSTGSPMGSEFQVNSYTTSGQGWPAVAADGSGNFLVVWESVGGQDGSLSGVFGQRFNSTGSPVGSEFQVNSYTTGDQRFPAVAADGAGNFVVVWASDGQDGWYYGVFGQRYSSAGSPVGGEFQVNTYTTSSQRYPAVAADGSGNFVVAWESTTGQDGSWYGVFGQRFDSTGTPAGSEFQVNTYTTDSQREPAVAADGSGNFIVLWSSGGQDGSAWGVFGQRFDSAGASMGSEFRVNTYTISDQQTPAVAPDGSGNFVAAWESPDGAGYGVFGQRVSNWIFIDGFDDGDACAWSTAVGGGC